MNNEEKILQLLGNMDQKIDTLGTRMDILEAKVDTMQRDIQVMKVDLHDVKQQVNVLYDWVDGIDIKVKKIDERTA